MGGHVRTKPATPEPVAAAEAAPPVAPVEPAEPANRGIPAEAAGGSRIGLDRFRCEVDSDSTSAELTYKVFACMAGPRLEVRIDPVIVVAGSTQLSPPAGRAFIVGFGELDRDEAAHGNVRGLRPSKVMAGVPKPVRPNETAIVRETALAFTERVPCKIGDSVNDVVVEASFGFFLREWGIKDLTFTATRLVIDKTSPLVAKLTELGMRRLGGTSFSLEGELGFMPTFDIETSGGRFVMTLESVELLPRKRPRRDPANKLVSSQVVTSEAGPIATDYLIDPLLDTTPENLARLLVESPDPIVTAQAAFLVGAHRLPDLHVQVRDCARDPAEDPAVRMNALWTLAQLSIAEDAGLLRELAQSESDPALREQAERAAAVHGLVKASELVE